MTAVYVYVSDLVVHDLRTHPFVLSRRMPVLIFIIFVELRVPIGL